MDICVQERGSGSVVRILCVLTRCMDIITAEG